MKIISVLFNPLLRRMFIGSLAVIVLSCSSDPHDVDISDVQVDMTIRRLDQDLFHHSEDDFRALNAQLKEKYDTFYKDYLMDIIAVGRPNDPMVHVHLEQFVNDPNWQETQAQIDRVFPDLSDVNNSFERAFRYHRYHFPDQPIPDLVYYNSGFNIGVYPTDQVLGIGLEWFLGPESPVIQRLALESFPQYFKDKLRPEYLVNNSVKGWLLVKHQELLGKEELLNLMIFHGKILYLMDAMFPKVSDEIKMNYSTEELEWCRKNEYNIWAHLIDADLLYTSKPKDLAGFINDGPFTPAFQQGSPARTGMWLGWQIVRQYMDKNSDVSLKEMLQEDNPQKMLKYYKP